MNYKYHKEEECIKKMNLFMCAGSEVLLLLYAYYQVSVKNAGTVSTTMGVGNLVLIILFMVANLAIVSAKRDWEHYKLLIAVEIGVEFLLISMKTEATFASMSLLGVLVVCIPYYKKHFHRGLAVSYFLWYMVVLVIRRVTHVEVTDINTICDGLIMMLLFYTIARIGMIAEMFNEHTMGVIAEQQAEEREILNGVLQISNDVRQEAQKSKDIMQTLYDYSESTSENMEKISQATESSADNIAEQSAMTQSIQQDIDDTVDHSKKMVDIAAESDKKISDNILVMDKLKSHAENIAETNLQVTEAMNRLQEKTKEVQAIAEMIFSISSQTNLLALNASIESARAGEAGRGFAVVADQIRQLAEQTRESTENIAQITGELGENADTAISSMKSSISAADEQQGMIQTAADGFASLKQDIDFLMDGIRSVDEKISSLSEANARMVDNIAQISSVTEEVTATAEQANRVSDENLSFAGDVRHALDSIMDTAAKVEKYM
jgi:methyl-accepting chemotaxis protein